MTKTKSNLYQMTVMKATSLFFVMLLSVSLIGCASENAPSDTSDTATDASTEEANTRPVTAEKLKPFNYR